MVLRKLRFFTELNVIFLMVKKEKDIKNTPNVFLQIG